MGRFTRWLAIVVFVLATARHAFAAPDPAAVFDQRWQRYDRPVAEGRTGRSWTWGPAITGVVDEHYFKPPTFSRKAQYFDKGRMEINQADGDPGQQWYVTSGLLPVELMRGQYEIERDYPGPSRESYVSALGDPDSFPAYPDLLPLYENPGTLEESELGRPITKFLRPDLTIGEFDEFAWDPATALVRGANNHGMPRAFADFQRQQGEIYVDGGFAQGQVYDPIYIFGLPVTPPVWTRTRIGGVERPVLFQVFERRVLTYNPANPAAFRVEMGNVGQHYYQWMSQKYRISEYETPFARNRREVRSRANPQVVYTLEVEQVEIETSPTLPPSKGVNFSLYASADGGATRELRLSQSIGPCRTDAWAALAAPRSPDADPGRIGLVTACVDQPSQGRGVGVWIRGSTDGGRTFTGRDSY